MKAHSLIQIMLAFLVVSGCAVTEPQALRLSENPTVQEVDDAVILDLTSGNTNVHGFHGVSGRVLSILFLVVSNMEDHHSERCGNVPTNNHIFFYKEGESTITVAVERRFAPKSRDLIDVQGSFVPIIPNTDILPGCRMQYVIHKGTLEIISKQ